MGTSAEGPDLQDVDVVRVSIPVLYLEPPEAFEIFELIEGSWERQPVGVSNILKLQFLLFRGLSRVDAGVNAADVVSLVDSELVIAVTDLKDIAEGYLAQ